MLQEIRWVASAPQEIRDIAVAADLPGIPEKYRLPEAQRKRKREDAVEGETILFILSTF